MTKFSVKNRVKSFKYAFNGILYAIRSQHNMWIHISILILVIIAGLFFNIAHIEWIVIAIVSGMVLMAEMFNTAIEVFLDAKYPNKNKAVGLVKDIAAGSVLLAAIAAAITGFIIFVPKIF